MRILEIRGLLSGLVEIHMADAICREYGVDAHDMKILAAIEELLRENKAEPNLGA